MNTTHGAIQRAELFKDVDELKEGRLNELDDRILIFKSIKNLQTSIEELQASQESILKGCHALIGCDEELSQRMDHISARIDIVNKRLRQLEQQK